MTTSEIGFFVVISGCWSLLSCLRSKLALAVLTHCKRGEDAILEANSHIYYEEVGGMSAVAGVSPRLVVGERGVLNPEEVKKAIRGKDIHFSKTTLICLENTHNMAGGTVIPLQIMEEICEIAHQSGIPIHLDGARLFNAALALGVKPVLFTKNFDSIMFCLSKGLGAPVGSILAGSKEFIQKARKNRKMLGGAMRQAGILAAAGIIALEKMVERLQADHEKALTLGKSLNKIEGIDVDLETLQTNMVCFDIKKSGLDTFQFLSKLEKNNILGYPRPPSKVRFVTHYGISEEDIYTTIEVVKEILKN